MTHGLRILVLSTIRDLNLIPFLEHLSYMKAFWNNQKVNQKILVQIIQIESFKIRQGRSEFNGKSQGQDHSHLKTLYKVSSGFQNQNFKEQTRPVARWVENY